MKHEMGRLWKDRLTEEYKEMKIKRDRNGEMNREGKRQQCEMIERCTEKNLEMGRWRDR